MTFVENDPDNIEYPTCSTEIRQLLLRCALIDKRLKAPVVDNLLTLEQLEQGDGVGSISAYHILTRLEQLKALLDSSSTSEQDYISNELIAELQKTISTKIAEISEKGRWGKGLSSDSFRELGLSVDFISSSEPQPQQFGNLTAEYLKTVEQLHNSVGEMNYDVLEHQRVGHAELLAEWLRFVFAHQLEDVSTASESELDELDLFFQKHSDKSRAVLFKYFSESYDLNLSKTWLLLKEYAARDPFVVINFGFFSNSWIALKMVADLSLSASASCYRQALYAYRFSSDSCLDADEVGRRMSALIDNRTGWNKAEEMWSLHLEEIPAVLNPELFVCLKSEADADLSEHTTADEDVSSSEHHVEEESSSKDHLADLTQSAGEVICEGFTAESVTEAVFEQVVDKSLEKVGLNRFAEIEDDTSEMPEQSRAVRPESLKSKITIASLIKENPVPIIAPLFIFAGVLLLLFSLWEQEPLIRYALTPITVISVSAAFSFIADKLEKHNLLNRLPLGVIRSVCIMLAPPSFMIAALLSTDDTLSVITRMSSVIALSIGLIAAWFFLFKRISSKLFKSMETIHSRLLLYMSTPVLLLPVVSGLGEMWFGKYLVSTILLVSVFYLVFMLFTVHVIRKVIIVNRFENRFVELCFHGFTSMGSYLIVWLLVHVYLNALPHLFTYAPLLVIFAGVLFILEFGLSKGQNAAQLHIMTYLGLFIMVIANIMAVSHPLIRVFTLALTAVVWFIPARLRYDEGQLKLSLGIGALAAGAISLVPAIGFSWFPWYMLFYIIGLQILSTRDVVTPLKDAAQRLITPIAVLTLVTSLLAHYYYNVISITWGVAFLLCGILIIYRGYKEDSLFHIHMGMLLCCFAPAYSGSLNFSQELLEGNTMVFGLSIVSIAWISVCRVLQLKILRDARSTVLWSIGTVALSFMILRIFFKDASPATGLTQQLIMAGPILMSVIMILTAYYSQSYLPVAVSLVIMVLIFPEIKDHYGIQMRSGLGSAVSGSFFITLAYALDRFGFLKKSVEPDLIWKKLRFPLKGVNAHIFSFPLLIAALFLVLRVAFYTYPVSYLNTVVPFEVKTFFAVFIAGLALHVLAVRFTKQIIAYAGYITHCAFAVHLLMEIGGEASLSWSLLLCFGLCYLTLKVIAFTAAETAQRVYQKCFGVISALMTVAVIVAFFMTVDNYRFSSAGLVASLFVFTIVTAGFAWRKHFHAYVLAAFLIGWQLFCYSGYLLLENFTSIEILNSITLGTTVFFGVIMASLFYGESRLKLQKYRLVRTLSFYSIPGLVCLLVTVFLGASDQQLIWNYDVLYVLWIVMLLMASRFIGSELIKITALLFGYYALTGSSLYFQPAPLALFAGVCAFVAVLGDKYPALIRSSYAPSFKLLPPDLSTAVVSAALYCCTVVLACSELPVAIDSGSLIAVAVLLIPAYLLAPLFKLDRRFLVSATLLFSCIGGMFALRINYIETLWFEPLLTTHIIAGGCAVLLLVNAGINRFFKVQHRSLSISEIAVAVSIIILTSFGYLMSRDVGAIAIERLLFSAFVTAVAGVHLRFLIPNDLKSKCYPFFTGAMVIAIVGVTLAGANIIFSLSIQPEMVFPVLALPPAFFYVRSELNHRNKSIVSSARDSAFFLLLLFALMYVYQPLVRLYIYSGYSTTLSHYMNNSFLLLGAGVALCRLRTLGAKIISLQLGSVAVCCGSFLCVFALPGLSFESAPAVATAISSGVAIAWLCVIHSNRCCAFIETFMDYEAGEVVQLRPLIDGVVLAVIHALFVYSVLRSVSGFLAQFNLLLIAAVWCVAGHFKTSKGFFYPAVLFAMLAVIAFGNVIWAWLGLYALVYAAGETYFCRRFNRFESTGVIWLATLSIALLVCTFIGDYSLALRAFIMFILWGATLVMIIPRKDEFGTYTMFFGLVMLYVPAIIVMVLFGSIINLSTWPGIAIVFALTTSVIHLYSSRIVTLFSNVHNTRIRLFQATISYLADPQSPVLTFLQICISGVTLALHILVLETSSAFSIVCCFILHGILIFYWCVRALKESKSFTTICAQVLFASLVKWIIVMITLLMPAVYPETIEMFTWVFVAAGVTAAKPFIVRQTSGVRVPIKYSVIALPLLTAFYAFNYPEARGHLPTVILLYSVIFTWKAASESDRFTLGYAFFGYNSWLIMMLLRYNIDSVHAYLIPACLTLLVFVELFKNRTSQLTANCVRTGALLIMLGYSFFDCIVTELHDPVSHIILISVCTLLLVVAVRMKVRVFILAGSIGIICDVIALFVLIILKQDQAGLRMILGSFFLIGGGLILTIHILYKNNREKVLKVVNKLFARFKSWE